jgi:hypothetical protein
VVGEKGMEKKQFQPLASKPISLMECAHEIKSLSFFLNYTRQTGRSCSTSFFPNHHIASHSQICGTEDERGRRRRTIVAIESKQLPAHKSRRRVDMCSALVTRV